MAKIALTDPFVRNVSAPVRGQVSYWDEGLSGFGLRVSQGGSKTFIVLHPSAKVRTQETIGRYPIVSLADARAEARLRLAEATLGKSRPKSVKWNRAVEEFLAEKARKRRASTVATYKRLLKIHFNFGETRLEDVSAHDLQKRIDKLGNTPSEEQHAFVAVKVFLRWAYRKSYIHENPMGRMEAPHIYVPRDRVLSDDELLRVWNASGDDVFGRSIKLLMLTGLRRGEVRALTPKMVGQGYFDLPPSVTKNGRRHILPIGALAQSLVTFPFAFGNWGKAKAKLDKRAGVYGWRIHDLRRTFASGIASFGTPVVVVEKLLNHISGSLNGVAGVYNRFDYQPEMKAAIERWDNHISALINRQRAEAA